MKIHIREAVSEDFVAVKPIADEVRELHARALQHIFSIGSGLTEHDYLGLLEGDASAIYVAEDDDMQDTIIGYVFLEMKGGRRHENLPLRLVALIRDIGVTEAYKGKGAGHALFEASVAWAEARGTDRLELMVWEFNQDAISFYERHGMEAVNRTMLLPLKNDRQHP